MAGGSAEIVLHIKGKDDASAALKSVSLNLSKMANVAGGILLEKGLSQIASMGTTAIKAGIDFNAMKEQATVAFTQMIGSGTEAQRFLEEIRLLANKTPFSFPDLVQGAQRMMAMGFAAKDVLPILTDIGDAISARGFSSENVNRVVIALGQMQSKGKIMAQEMLQLTEAGIPAWRFLAQEIGTSVPGAMDKVEKSFVSAETGMKAIRAGIQREFGGMMEDQSKTFGGMLSTIKDWFTQASGTILEPFFNIAKGYMKDFLGAVGDGNAQQDLDRIALAAVNVAIQIESMTTAMYRFSDSVFGALDDLNTLGGLLPGGTKVTDLSRLQIGAAGARLLQGQSVRDAFISGGGGLGGSTSGQGWSGFERQRAILEDRLNGGNGKNFATVEEEWAFAMEDGAKVAAKAALQTEGLGGAIEKVAKDAKTLGESMMDTVGKLRSAASALFGTGTREELQNELRQAQLEKTLAALPEGSAQVEVLRKHIESQLAAAQKSGESMQAQNRIQQLQLQLADQTILTEKEQNTMAQALLERTREITGALKTAADSAGITLVAGLDDAMGASHNLAGIIRTDVIPAKQAEADAGWRLVDQLDRITSRLGTSAPAAPQSGDPYDWGGGRP